MMKITDYLASQPYQPYQPAHRGPGSSAVSRQASTFNQDNSITLTTKEGDKVSISQSFSAALELRSDTKTTANGYQQSFTAASLQENSFNLHVEGDLSDEELADITKLVDDLYTIATDFFNGDIETAMGGASLLGSDMGSISDLSASFMQTTTVTTYSSSLMNSYHPLPDLQQQPGELSDRLQNTGEHDSSKNVSFNDIIKAQWNQISTMLDLFQTELQEKNLTVPTPETNPAPLYVTSEMPLDIPSEESKNSDETGTENIKKEQKNTGEQMMNKIANTMDHHPRLSPFIVPLASHAIDKAAETAHTHDPTKLTEMTANLKNEFLNQFDRWLFS